MERRVISAETQRRYDEVAAGLAGAGVKASSMFGMPTLKLKGKAIGGLWGDAMTFKLASTDGSFQVYNGFRPSASLFVRLTEAAMASSNRTPAV